MFLTRSLYFVFTGKMKDFQELVNKTNQKLKKKKSVLAVDLTKGTTSDAPSTPVVIFFGEEPTWKGLVESSKRKRMDAADKGMS